MFECEHRWELVLWGSTEVLGVVSGISRQCLMHILADLLSKITSCEQLKGDCTKSPSAQARHYLIAFTRTGFNAMKAAAEPLLEPTDTSAIESTVRRPTHPTHIIGLAVDGSCDIMCRAAC